ncbi:MAG TPA: sugar phosphate isomerase/epimerase family protein [Gemmata sp.]|jgi:sugar phosphate isomerase/epimerase|nr:sugar phosphate isomerase/epimerase family protein [Gemmata sp.]
MQLGLFSISYGGLWGQATLDLRAFIRHAAELGFDAVMLAGKRPHISPLDVDDRTIAALKDELKTTRLGCAVVAAYTDLTPASAAEVPYLEMQIAYVESLARIGAALGASVVRVFTAYANPAASPHAAWQRAVTTLREMCDRAAAHGMTIAIQNHHDLAVHTTAILELLHDIDRPNCKLGFDAWSPALRGENLYEAAKIAAPHTAIITNADYIRLPQYRYRPELVNYEAAGPDLVRAVPFGTGFIDYPAFFQGLRDGGFDGLATYEMCSPIRGGGSQENLDHYARSYVRWMREHGLQ